MHKSSHYLEIQVSIFLRKKFKQRFVLVRIYFASSQDLKLKSLRSLWCPELSTTQRVFTPASWRQFERKDGSWFKKLKSTNTVYKVLSLNHLKKREREICTLSENFTYQRGISWQWVKKVLFHCSTVKWSADSRWWLAVENLSLNRAKSIWSKLTEVLTYINSGEKN